MYQRRTELFKPMLLRLRLLYALFAVLVGFFIITEITSASFPPSRINLFPVMEQSSCVDNAWHVWGSGRGLHHLIGDGEEARKSIR